MQGAAQYTGSLDACRAILRSEGLPGIYKGYAATLGGAMLLSVATRPRPDPAMDPAVTELEAFIA